MMVEQEKTGKQSIIQRLFTPVPKEYKKQFEEKRLQTNISRMYAFSIYIIVVQIVLNLINMIRPSDSKSSDIMVYVFLSLGTLCVGIIYWVLLLLVKKGKIQKTGIKRFLVESLIYIYLGIQLTFSTLNIISTGGVNSYIIAILILGMLPIVSPVQSLLSIGLSFAYLLFAMFSFRHVSDAWNSILITDVWTNLIIITGLTACISVFMYDMFVSNFMQSVRLEKSNEELLSANAELASMNDKLEIIANTDQMTGIYNRRALSMNFDSRWRTSAIKGSRLAVAIIDIDLFKAYNDKFGHLKGDECLKAVATSLFDSFRRANDMVCRYGGEEFLIIYDATEENALELIERARMAVENLKIPHADTSVSPYVTISVGLCVIAPGSENITTDMALKAADDALYASKHAGRNQTTVTQIGGGKSVVEAEK